MKYLLNSLLKHVDTDCCFWNVPWPITLGCWPWPCRRTPPCGGWCSRGWPTPDSGSPGSGTFGSSLVPQRCWRCRSMYDWCRPARSRDEDFSAKNVTEWRIMWSCEIPYYFPVESFRLIKVSVCEEPNFYYCGGLLVYDFVVTSIASIHMFFLKLKWLLMGV